jgi:hypothetical protein
MMTPKEGHTSFEDDELARDEGILVSRGGGRGVGCEGECAPDDHVEDPVNDSGVPGTADDLPYDYGVETARAADEMLGSIERPSAGSWGVGSTGPAGEGEEQPLGRPEERELWQQQQPLIEEAEAEERHFAGLREEDVPATIQAIAEDSAEVLPEAPDGTSATGGVTER